jgi:prepilin-type N-terminal cleavage/methylation domain-containing protein
MSAPKGWTLVELLVVIAIIALLAGMLLPSFVTVRQRARLASCAGAMRAVHQGLLGYAAGNRRRLPPFAFCDEQGNLPLSGHWGGTGEAGDPSGFWRSGFSSVNLWVLADDRLVAPRQLVCPGAEGALRDGTASYFPHTLRFSTHCLRFPPSEDLFSKAPSLAYFGGTRLLQIYVAKAGGQTLTTGGGFGRGGRVSRVPVVRLDLVYRTVDEATCGDGDFQPLRDAVFSDPFWRQDYSAPAATAPGATAYPVRASWCHGERFNVMYGCGSVRTVTDDGTVESHTVPPDGELPDDGCHWATYSEPVWQYFDARR